MAIVLYKNADRTVDTISDRNSIDKKIDNMVVTVLDAISDPDAGSGVATYRWSAQLNKWLLISKSTVETMSFETVESNIVAGKIIPQNVPSNNVIWDIYVVDGTTIINELRLEDVIVTPTLISGLGLYDGYKLRYTYAYGSVTQQITSYVDSKIADMVAGAPVDLDTFKGVSDKIALIEDSISAADSALGNILEFEGALT
jgi:hypothetical protein